MERVRNNENTNLHSRANLSTAPLLAVVTLTADLQECNEKGIEIVIYGNREELQKQVITRLGIGLDRSHRREWDEKNSQSCADLRRTAKKVLEHLQLSSIYFDNFGDHCFCTSCEKKRIYTRGNPPEKYAIPLGWYRYGIMLHDEYINKRAEIETWHVAYHGTKPATLESILSHHKIMFPGDRLNDGTVLPVRLGQAWADWVGDGKKTVIYISPSILYSSDFLYAPPIQINGEKYQIVLQCRVKPTCYKKFPQTIGLKTELDNEFPNKELEWVTADREGVIPYGLLIRKL